MRLAGSIEGVCKANIIMDPISITEPFEMINIVSRIQSVNISDKIEEKTSTCPALRFWYQKKLKVHSLIKIIN